MSEPVRWEYRYITQSHHIDENLTALNAAGSDGWEVCHVGRIFYLLKRRVVGDQDAGYHRTGATA